MKTIYEKPQVFTDVITTYCGGCGHGIVGKLIAELVDELKLQENGILVWPIGCSCLSDRYYDMDAVFLSALRLADRELGEEGGPA